MLGITEVAVAKGWTRDEDVQQQIDDSIADAVRRARAQLPSGPGLSHCEECGQFIPEARRRAVPGVRLCIACQEGADRTGQGTSPYNRRGSKDSQLR
jgi:phage/conjugal plasmid C-4 type zinc finger TraR family protein